MTKTARELERLFFGRLRVRLQLEALAARVASLPSGPWWIDNFDPSILRSRAGAVILRGDPRAVELLVRMVEFLPKFQQVFKAMDGLLQHVSGAMVHAGNARAARQPPDGSHNSHRRWESNDADPR